MPMPVEEEVDDEVVEVVVVTFGFGSESYEFIRADYISKDSRLVFSESELTNRFKLPMRSPSRNSLASSLCPTSSNASVAS
jgi:hypothetical protein